MRVDPINLGCLVQIYIMWITSVIIYVNNIETELE